MTVLIVGADGMIGYGLWKHFARRTSRKVIGSIRSKRDLAAFGADWRGRIVVTGDIDADASLRLLFENVEPSVVINCAGATAHLAQGESPLVALPSNALLPHRLHAMARDYGARMIHLSTDCVYDGAEGHYPETRPVNARTYYGLSKALGEVVDAEDALTIRTSPIGYELSSSRGLLAWFLGQSGTIKGFTNAYFSGLTNEQLARIMDEFILPDDGIHGLYHVTGPRISKFELVTCFKKHFGSSVVIEPDGELILDRSLDGSRFCARTGYASPGWDEMIVNLLSFGSDYPASAVTGAV